MPVSTTVIPIPSITDEDSSAVVIQDSTLPHPNTNNDNDSPFLTSKSTKDINIDKDLLLHDVFKHTMNGNFLSPISKPTMKNCLDVGFGSGIWMMEVASMFPQAQFFGIDIEPRAPQSVYPRNCTFEKGDFLDGLPYANKFFDLVCIRLTLNVLTLDQLNSLFKEISRVLKPNGYVEFLEEDLQSFKNCGDKTLNIVTKLLNEKKTDVTMILLQDLFKKNGFSYFKNIKVNIPMGKWAGMVGELYFSAFKLLLTTTSNTPPTNDEFKMIEAECNDHNTSFLYHAGFAKKL